MKKISMIFVLVGAGALIFWAQSKTNTKNICSTNKDVPEQCSCSQAIDSLQYCAAVSVDKEDPAKSVVVRQSLTNVSDKPITVERLVHSSMITWSYDITITDPLGKKVKSKSEIVDEENAKRPPQDRTFNLPLNSGWSESKQLAPKESLDGSLNLSQFYSFDQKGTYKIEIVYKVQTLEDKKRKQFVSGVISVDVE